MAKVSPIYYNFNGGELSQLLMGRSDLDKYKTGLEVCENFIPMVQGPLVRRSGTVNVTSVKDQNAKVRLMRFVFSRDQAYVLEFGDQYIRFYTQHGQIGSGPFSLVFAPAFNTFSTYEISSPYSTADLFELSVAQSADILYIDHPDYPQRELRRYGNTNWVLETPVFSDGPYIPTNSTETKVTVSGSGATRTLTFDALTGINDGAGFEAADVGRMIRVDISGAAGPTTGWQWLTIDTITSTLIVECTADNDSMINGSATADWRLGLWGIRNGYPSAVTFSGDRLFHAGPRAFPQRADGSRVGDYLNYAPTDLDGTVVDDHAVAITLNADEVNDIRWLMDDEKGLAVGTEGGEWVIRPTQAGGVLTPDNIDAKRTTTYGSAQISSVRTGKAIMFVTPSKRKVREMAYVFEDDGFRSPDATLISEHITGLGLVEMAFQREPQSILWAVREDGQLAALTYEKDNSVIGWHRHIIGGTDTEVESIAVIPNPDGGGEELWLSIKRTIDGATTRYIEYMKPVRTRTLPQADSFYVDSGLTYNGDEVTSIGGLQHLEGETVSILADGNGHADKVVVAGFITLDRPASIITVGLKFVSNMKTLRPEAGASDGTAQGKTAKITFVTIRFWESLGGEIGQDENNLDPVVLRKTSDPMDAAPPLFTGDHIMEWDADYDADAQIYIRQSQPFPYNVLALMPQVVTQDNA